MAPGFPERDAGVGVVDGWEPAVGVDGQVLGLLDVRERNGDYFVREVEFLEDDGDFGRVGAALTPDFDGLDLG